MQVRKSLDTIIEQQEKGAFSQYLTTTYKIDEYQEFFILYSISQYLTNIHSNDQVHGNLRLTNILLDEKCSPQVTFDENEDKSIKYLVSLSPEAIEQEQLTKESDIYSFGIIILQVLTHKINVFSDYSEDADTIKLLIKNNINPFNYTESVPSHLSSLLSLCFSGKRTKRPSARTIQSILERILSEKQYEKQMNKLKNKSNTESNNISSAKKINTNRRQFLSNKFTSRFIFFPCISESKNDGLIRKLQILTNDTHESNLNEDINIDYCDECDDLKEEDITTIMQQCNVSRGRAIKALHEANGDLVTAVMNLAI